MHGSGVIGVEVGEGERVVGAGLQCDSWLAHVVFCVCVGVVGVGVDLHCDSWLAHVVFWVCIGVVGVGVGMIVAVVIAGVRGQ